LKVLVLGSNSMPLQVFEFETCLPTSAVTTLVENYLTTSCVGEFLVD